MTTTHNVRSDWTRRVVLAVAAALLLLAVPTVLMRDDEGGGFAVAALAFSEVALVLVVIPSFAGRKGRDPA